MLLFVFNFDDALMGKYFNKFENASQYLMVFIGGFQLIILKIKKLLLLKGEHITKM